MDSALLILQLLAAALCVVAWAWNRRRGPAILLLGGSILLDVVKGLTEGRVGVSIQTALSLGSILLLGLFVVSLIASPPPVERSEEPSN